MDLVERLRQEAMASEELHPGDSEIEVMRQAASRIEYLEGSLKAVLESRNVAVDAWVERYTKAEAALDRMTLALTPSSVTKAALLGEFKFFEERFDDKGEAYTVDVTVPWTTVKDIMLAIRNLAGEQPTMDSVSDE